MKKAPTTYSIEALLKILETDTLIEKEDIEFLQDSVLDQDIVPFLSYYNFQPGDKPVAGKTIYQLYYQWSKCPVLPHKFGTRIAEYFVKNDLGYLLLNKTLFDIAKEVQLLLTKKRPASRLKNNIKHFHHFFDRYKIVKGDCYIESYIFYYLYDKWCYEHKTKKHLSYSVFFRFIKHFFPLKSKTTKGERIIFVGVNKEILSYLTEDQLERLRNDKDLIYASYKKETAPSKKTRQR